MICPVRLAADENGNLEDAIRSELISSRIEAIAVASVLSPRELAKRLGIDFDAAKRAREAAKKHIRELWAFEEAAWERE